MLIAEKKLFLWAISCFLLFPLTAVPQQHPDAETILMEQATNAFYIASQNADSAMQLANEAYEQGKKRKSKKLVANASNTIGWVYLHKGRLDSAAAMLERSKELFSSLQSHEDVIKVNINLAEVHNRQHQYVAAIERLLEADSMSNQIKHIPLQTDVKRLMGIVYRQTGDNEKAVYYFRQALDGFEWQKDYLRYNSTLIGMSILYRTMKLYDSSFAVLQKGLQIAEQHGQEPYPIAMLHENLAETYFETKQYEDALKHFFTAYHIFTEINHPSDIAYESSCIGKTYTELKQYPQAEPYLLQSYHMNDSLRFTSHKLDAARNLAEMYRKWGHWEKAYDFLQVSNRLKDSLDIAAQIEKTTEIKEKYETEKKEAQIQLLRARNQQTIWWFLAAVLAVIMAGLLFWLRSYKRRIREERILNYFATSLYNQNTVDDVFWDIAKNCVSKLGFEDCVVYGYDSNRKMLVQKAAYGPKNPSKHIISNLIEIPLGKGIVGAVAASLQPEIVNDTSKDPRYIVDDASRRSEITIPILLDGKLLGIIDSEHSRKGFYTQRHVNLLQKIADTCSKKITKYFVEESLRRQIATDLHDDMGSTLSSINIISKLAAEKEVPGEYLVRQMHRINDNTRKMMDSLGDMVWAINPVNDNTDSLIAKMKEWAGEICEYAEVVFRFEVNADILNIPMNAAKRKNIFLIFKEAVNNALKYSGCTRIMAGIRKTGTGQLLLFVQDNGKGFDEAVVKKGNGLNNMKERALMTGGNISVESSPGGGTTIALTFVAEETPVPIFGGSPYIK
ncbi:MAG: tetratricopeptide repeat protein [Chitinophagaceae bacterium]|nr:tetratricopeptide repeat protein [Chitinophagaceae bacterium]